MRSDMESHTSSLVSNERQWVVHLLLTSLSGEHHQVTVDLQEFDRVDEFETAVLELLPTIGGSSTFGCELSFVRSDTGQLLQSPIWDTLGDCNHFFLLQFVDGQEILSALLKSLPLFHFSSCRHSPLSYFTGCACFFGGVFVCVFGLVFGAFSLVTAT